MLASLIGLRHICFMISDPPHDADQASFASSPPPLHFNMARYCLAHSAEKYPEKTALTVIADGTSLSQQQSWSYCDVEALVLDYAALFRRKGLEPGSFVLLRLGNEPVFAFLFFAAIAAGLVPVPISAQFKQQDIARIIKDVDPDAVIISDQFEQEISALTESGNFTVLSLTQLEQQLSHNPAQREYHNSLAHDPAYLIYTSGTSAQPKGVLHAQRSAWGRRPMYRDWYDICASDIVLHAGAFNWTYTLGVGLTDPWANGASSIIFIGEKTPQIWPRLIAHYSVTLFAAVPSLYRQILKYTPPEELVMPSLRHGLCAGEALPTEVADTWYGATQTRLYQALGMSELSTYISFSPHIPLKPKASGKAQTGRQVDILPQNPDDGDAPLPPHQTGLLAVHRSDPGLMLGYWKRPDEERAVYRGAWFCGGDLAYKDEDGYIFHAGRANDLMNAFGYRVAPQEVEDILRRHSLVQDIAVAELAVAKDVEVIAAFIIAASGKTKQDEIEQSLRGYAAENLADYKQPRAYFFIDSLPQTANGKITRSSLRERYGYRPA